MEIIDYDNLYEQAIVDFSNKIGLKPTKVISKKNNLTDYLPEDEDTEVTVPQSLIQP